MTPPNLESIKIDTKRARIALAAVCRDGLAQATIEAAFADADQLVLEIERLRAIPESGVPPKRSSMAEEKPWTPSVETQLEMANGCLDMVHDVLEAHGIDMKGCPPMMYEEAIHNLYVWTAKASAACVRDHAWHDGDEEKVGECLLQGIKTFGRKP